MGIIILTVVLIAWGIIAAVVKSKKERKIAMQQAERKRAAAEAYKKQMIDKYGEELAARLVNHDYFIGMTPEQLMDCKGHPTKVEREILKTKEKHMYIYGTKNSGDVFIFENGELTKFKDR